MSHNAENLLKTLDDVAEFLQHMKYDLSECVTERYETEHSDDGEEFLNHVGYRWASAGNLANMAFFFRGDELRERIPEILLVFHRADVPLDIALLREAVRLLTEAADPDSINEIEQIFDEFIRLISLTQPDSRVAKPTNTRKTPPKTAKTQKKLAARYNQKLWHELLDVLHEHHGGQAEYNSRHLPQATLGMKLGIDRRQVGEMLDERGHDWGWYKDNCGTEQFLDTLKGLHNPMEFAYDFISRRVSMGDG